MSTNYHDPIPMGAPANSSVVNSPLGQLDSAIGSVTTTILAGTAGDYTVQEFAPPTILTISVGGAITPTQALHAVAAASGTADDLDTITINEGRFAVLIADTGDTITIRHNIGNIRTFDGLPITLTDAKAIQVWRLGSLVLVLGDNGVLDAANVTYTPADLNDWNSAADPGNTDDALDQLAERVTHPILPANTSALAATEGAIGWHSSKELVRIYDGQRERSVSETGWLPYARQQGLSPAFNSAGSETIAANGGSCAIPIWLHAQMRLYSVTVRNISTATQRTWGWDLYAQYLNNGNGAENTLSRVACGNADETFTPGAASNQTIVAASAPSAGDGPIYLGPGLYWLVIQSRHATSTLVLQNDTPAAAFLMGGSLIQTKTTTNPNGSSIDMVAATWTKAGRLVAAMLNGVVFGESAAF